MFTSRAECLPTVTSRAECLLVGLSVYLLFTSRAECLPTVY